MLIRCADLLAVRAAGRPGIFMPAMMFTEGLDRDALKWVREVSALLGLLLLLAAAAGFLG